MEQIDNTVSEWPEPTGSPRIPLSSPDLGRSEKRNLLKAFDSTQISGTGYFVDKSEALLSDLLQTNALVVANGSVAITLALRALEIEAGDEVILPSFTYAATASAVVNIGATPRFIDSNLQSWNIHAEDIEKMIGPKTKAILVVDIYGNPAEMKKISDLARRRNIALVQDSAEAFGAKYLGFPLGKFADISTYSFFANKIIACGEGGAVTTNSPELLTRMRLLRGQGMSQKTRYYFEEAGYNFRLSNMSAAVLSAQLSRSVELIEKRLTVFDLYRHNLSVEFVEPISPPNSEISPWLFSIRLPQFAQKQKIHLAKRLAQNGIQTRPLFYPLPSMPAFSSRIMKSDGSFLNSECIAAQGISLPTFPGLKEKDIINICKIVNSSI